MVRNAIAIQRRRNNAEELEKAAALSARFHGRPPRRIIELLEKDKTRTDLADLGRLVELVVITGETTGVKLTFNDNVRCACSADGRQLYFKGGSQCIDLAQFKIPLRDDVELGPVHGIAYFTSKDFHAFEPTIYEHEFGEDGGTRPTLAYNVLNRRLYLIGGSYQVKRSGIVN